MGKPFIYNVSSCNALFSRQKILYELLLLKALLIIFASAQSEFEFGALDSGRSHKGEVTLLTKKINNLKNVGNLIGRSKENYSKSSLLKVPSYLNVIPKCENLTVNHLVM